MKKLIFAVAFLAIGCSGSDNPTGPSPTLNSSETTVTTQDNTTAPVADTQPVPETPETTGMSRDLTVTISDGTSRDVCIFVNGPHPQKLLAVNELRGSGTYPFDKTQVLAALECGETVELQVDLVMPGECEKGSDNISPSHWGYISISKPIEECEPPCEEEPVIVSEEITEEWSGECVRDVPTKPTASTVATSCTEQGVATITRTFKQCDMLWTTTDTKPIRRGCECDEEECEVLPEIGKVLPKEGNPWDECSAYGDFTPVCKTEAPEDFSVSNDVSLPTCDGSEDAVFYICKQSTQMVTMKEYLEGACPEIEPRGWSHITGCECD